MTTITGTKGGSWLLEAGDPATVLTPERLSDEHRLIARTVQEFAAKEVVPSIDRLEQKDWGVARHLLRRAGELGLLGVDAPEEFGGVGLDKAAALVVSCNMAGSASFNAAFGAQSNLVIVPLLLFGTPEQKNRYLPTLISGEMVGAYALSESASGSDALGANARAAKLPDGSFALTGEKMWTTNGVQADWMCLLANTGDGAPHNNKSLICVPMKAKGVTVAKKIDKIGMMSSDTAQIFLDDVRVPQRNRIGDEGMGFTYQMLQFQEERLWAAAHSITSMDRSIEQTIDYARQRFAFGKAVLDNQYVHFRLAELKTEVEALRSLTYRAVEEYAAGKDVTELASMAKLKCGRLLREVSDGCLQFWGGMGYTWENPLGRAYRDGRLASIGGGTDEIMLGIICKHMGILPGQSNR